MKDLATSRPDAKILDADRSVMGSPEEAETELVRLTVEWRRLRQPMMGTAERIRQIEARDKEVRFRLANAALLWLWHRENPAKLPSDGSSQ